MIDESELRRRFGELQEADRESAPGFAQTFARARRARGVRLRVRTIVIGAAAAVAIAAVGLGIARSRSPSALMPTIATWRAPTDVLLGTPGSAVLHTIPVLGASILDAMILIPLNKGT